jgi:hypothetical protein
MQDPMVEVGTETGTVAGAVTGIETGAEIETGTEEMLIDAMTMRTATPEPVPALAMLPPAVAVC